MLSDEEHRIMQAAQNGTTMALAEELGISHTRLMQRLNHMIDRQDVLAAYPTLTYRLRRITRRG
ncbi:DUF3263 domain-containing protein [Gordonia sp. PP30]|uniref:DUF3263 domain-containing protein n=1 Tax=Gordonia sp. PP30 TaxID=2935861 RepID=UPI001FFEA723|nr:DUF3263 domain-containing protein [Gordonia sp. PP30]UQE74243.1 DUF3263 domain-containing protein [Gordonia sp. PP30]